MTLTCLVRGFKPQQALVRWQHGNEAVAETDYLTWGPQPEPQAETFAMTSLLRVDTEAWRRGDVFTCLVGHESLPTYFTNRSIDRMAGKPTHLNVSVVVGESDGVCYGAIAQ